MSKKDSKNAWHGPAPWVRVGDLLRLERSNLIVAIMYSLAIGILSLALPLATQTLVNTVAFGSLLQPIAVLSILLFAFLLFSAILQALRYYVVEILQRRIFVRSASDAADRLLRARSSSFDGTHPPELVNRFLEVVTVQKSAATLLVEGLTIMMQTVIGMGLLAVYHPYLGLFDFFLLISIVVVLFPMGWGAVNTAVHESKAKYALVAWLQEVGRHLHTFKSGPGAQFALHRANELVSEYVDDRKKHFRILLRQIIGSLTLQVVASTALLGVGGYLVIARELTLGQLIASELVLTLVVSGIAKFGKHLETYYDLCAAVDKLGYLTDLQTETSGPDPVPGRSGGASVTVRGVNFSYPNKHKIFEGLNLDIKPGERVAVRGRSGDGKSTLVDILWRLRTPQSGVVEIDGNDIRNYQVWSLRTQVALVRAHEVFQGSILDNVSMGRTEIDTVQVREALAAVGLLEEVDRLEHGVLTEVSTFGLPLSSGQALRLALARAIAGKPRLLIIDEVLDQVDDVSLQAVTLNHLFRDDAPWTLIVTTEQDRILERCDTVYSLRNGKLEPESSVRTESNSI
ncbi:ABC transporter [Bryobacterales bacterium F-183]|nr:ABC transporter [Bryobacterales bacterium F-183]